MSILEQIVDHAGDSLTVAVLRERLTGHMVGPISSVTDRPDGVPGEHSLIRAGRLLGRGSPAMLGAAAAWIDLLAALESAGLSARERFTMVVETLRSDLSAGHIPGIAARWAAASSLEPADAAAFAAELLADPPRGDLLTAAVCAAAVPDLPIPEAIDDAYLFYLPAEPLQAVLRRIPPERRQAILLRLMQAQRSNQAMVKLESLAFVHDLVVGEELEVALANLAKRAGTSERARTLASMVT